MNVNEVNLPEYVPQLVTATEFNLQVALDSKNLPNTKNLIEGAGAMVRDKLYTDSTFRYKGACFIISTNYRPFAEEYGKKVQADVWQPLKARTDVVNFTHEHEDGDDFPYNKTDLAHALQFLVDKPALCRAMKEHDLEQVNADDEEELKRQEVELGDKFEAALKQYDFVNLLGQKRHDASSILEELQNEDAIEQNLKRQKTMIQEDGSGQK